MIRIIGDSSLDGTTELFEKNQIDLVQLNIDIDGVPFDTSGTRDDLLEAIRLAKETCKTSAPSPGAFMEAAGSVGDAFFITLSGKLSGTYNSAMTAVEMLREEYPERVFHVFDSKAAGSMETLIALKIRELEGQGLSSQEIIVAVEAYIETAHTYFILENYETLILNGRIKPSLVMVIKALKIIPVMTTLDGEIESYKKVRGTNKAYQKIVEAVEMSGIDVSSRNCVISHCHNEERARQLKADIESKYAFKEVVIVPSSHITTVYANDQGIIVSF